MFIVYQVDWDLYILYLESIANALNIPGCSLKSIIH